MSELATTIQPFTNTKVLDSTTETMWSALAVLLLTTVHHVYGAYITTRRGATTSPSCCISSGDAPVK